MSIVSHARVEFIDGKECFSLWVELGSVEKVSKYLESVGKVNPRTKKRYSIMGVWSAAITWATDNPDDAWPYYVEAGTAMNREEWNEWLVARAITTRGYSKKNFLAWVKKQGFERYRHVYAEKYGLS